MLIEETRPEGSFNITAYQPGRIEIDGQSYAHAVVLGAHGISACAPGCAGRFVCRRISAGRGQHLARSDSCGHRRKHLFLHPKITAALAAKGIGLESMSTAAACRTVMVLQGEGRRAVGVVVAVNTG